MNISRVNISSQNNVSSKQPALDNHESSLRKQITDLQEKVKTISNNQEMSEEQKTKEKQAAQEQLQNLNSELRRYQQQKKQEEAAQKQEDTKQAIKEVSEKSEVDKTVQTEDGEKTEKTSGVSGSNASKIEKDEEETPTLLGSKEAGVLVTLSSNKEQIADMGRIRTALEGRQRTAPTEEEKASLQEKIARVSSGIGKKIVITEDTIASFQKTSKGESGNGKESADALKQRQKELKIYADEKLDAINRTGIINNKKMFDNISFIFS